MQNQEQSTLVQTDYGLPDEVADRVAMLEAELKATRRKLEALEARSFPFEATIRQIPFGVMLFDRDRRLHLVNDRFGEFCGRAAERIHSREDLEEIALFKELGLIRPLRRLLEECEPFVVDQAPGVAFAGETRYLRFEGQVLYDLGGEVEGFTVVAEDIAELGDSRGRLKSSLGHLRRVMLGAVEAMSTMVERRDPFVAGHQKRVAELSLAIGRELGMDVFQLEGLRIMALLHDIGKVAVPAEILCKPARLSPAETGVVRTGPAIAGRILARVDFPWPVAKAIQQHQERIDGSGYPKGLAGDEILLEARILAVADTVEAMLTYRPYRPAHELDVVMEEIESGRGRVYDGQVVDACVALFREKGFEFKSS